MNKSLLMSRVSLMLCFFAFFFLLVDKVEAKPATCTYEYQRKMAIGVATSSVKFTVNENGELNLATNSITLCDYYKDENGNDAEKCTSPVTVKSLVLKKSDVEKVLDKTGRPWYVGPVFSGDRNSEKFLSTMKNAFGWEKDRVHNVLDNGCTGSDCNVSIKLTEDGYCPQIYFAENYWLDVITAMPSSVDCDGSKVFDWIASGSDNLYTCVGAYDAIENRQCNSEEINKLINERVDKNEELVELQGEVENIRSGIRNLELDPSGKTTKEEIENYCNQPVKMVEEYSNKINQYTNQISPEDVLNSILSDVKTQFPNCRLPMSDDEIKQYASTRYKNFIDSLNRDISGIASSANSKTTECLKKAENISQEEKDEIKNDIDQTTDEIRDTVSDSIEKFKDKITSITFGTDNIPLNCQGLLGDDLLSIIDEIFGYVKIAAPILLIVLGSIDFGQAVLLDDKDALRKAGSKFVKRAIVCVAIFFVPTILSYILHFVDGIGVDPLCGIK